MTTTPTRETATPSLETQVALELAGALAEALTHPLEATDRETLAHVRASQLEMAAKFDAGDTDALGGVTVSYPAVEAVAVALAEALTYPLDADHRATLENEFENMLEALAEGGAEDAFAAEVATRRAVVAAEVATRRDALAAEVARIRAAEAEQSDDPGPGTSSER